MKEFEIWMEGYIVTGNSSDAQMIGTGMGKDFDEAVSNFIRKSGNEYQITPNNRERYRSEQGYLNRKSNWNAWGCNLFDNETDARKSFG